MMKKLISFLVVLILISSPLSIKAQVIPADSMYLGQTPPGAAPKVFKLPVADKSFLAERITISNDGRNIYYEELDGYTEMDGKPHTMRVKYFSFTGGKWKGPFTLFEGFGSPYLFPSGDTMIVQNKGLTSSYFSVKTGSGWGNPVRFLAQFKNAHYFQKANSGNCYMASNPANTVGNIDRSKLIIKGTDTTITSLGLPINGKGNDLDFFISRNEDYAIITTNRGLCLSLRKNDGSWSDPINLGKEINFGLNAWGPYVTADNKYLFFTTGTKLDYSDTRIHWVKIGDFIEKQKLTLKN